MWTDADGVSNVDQVKALIEDERPDLVSLVEVDEPWGSPSILQGVAEQLGYHWAFVPAFEYRCQGGFGNALLSRTPFSSLQQWQLLSPRLYDGSEPSEPRAIVVASIDVAGQQVVIGSTHLPRHDSEMRNEAAGRLLDLLNRLPEPWIVCGDFNQPVSEWLRDRYNVAPSPSLATYPTTDPVEHLDYAVFAGLELSGRTLPLSGSDHLPMVITSDR